MPESCSCDQLMTRLAVEYPVLEVFVQAGRLAVNQGFVTGEAKIDPDGEIALISMVSGG